MDIMPWNQHHVDSFTLDPTARIDLPKSFSAEEVNALIGHSPGTRAGRQGSPPIRGESGLFEEFPSSRLEVRLRRRPGVITDQPGGYLDDRTAERRTVLFDQHEFVVIGEGDDRDHAAGVRAGDVFPTVAFDEIEKTSGVPGLEGGVHADIMTTRVVVVEAVSRLEFPAMNPSDRPPFLNAYESIIARRTAHAYRDVPVDHRSMERALHAANHAPCHKLTFPWRFIRIGPQGRAATAQLAVRIKAEQRPLSEADAKKVHDKLMGPPELVVACQTRSADPFRSREDYAACCCAIQNFFVSLAGEGVSGKWSTGGITRDLRMYGLLGLDPGAFEVIGFLWAGVADPPTPITRPPMDAVVRAIP